MNKNIFLSPHNDDETLFGAYTIMREKPLVLIVTDSYIQYDRGDMATKEQRIKETQKAMKLAGAEVEFLHISDKDFSEDLLLKKLLFKYKSDLVYAPAVEEGGNPIHNTVGSLAEDIFDNVRHYMTYVAGDDKTEGTDLMLPTEKEKELKKKMLACYPSQLGIPTCAVFFTHPEVLEWESFE